MQTQTIAIIGAGNMGASLLGGLLAIGFPADKLWITDKDPHKLEALQQQFKVHITHQNSEAANTADIILLAVKPQIMAEVAKELAPTIQQKTPLILSIAAGISVAQLEQWFGNHHAIIRCMPNTPALIRCGATALYANAAVSIPQKQLAESLLRAVGTIIWLDDEKQMNAVTALSGSGPAYFFLVIEILQQIGNEMGLPQDLANLLTLQTALGSARMAIESGQPVHQLRHQVTSPGGTTEAALAILDKDEIRTLFTKALTAAKSRAEELGS